MAKEIERKFLVDSELEFLENALEIRIEQGYLMHSQDKGAHLRVRIEFLDDTPIRGSIAIKYEDKKNGRDEFEYEVPLEDAFEMLNKTKERIVKTRKSTLIRAIKVDYDVFDDGDSWVELEVPSLAFDIDEELPDYVKECLGKEVTDDPKFTNIYKAIQNSKNHEGA